VPASGGSCTWVCCIVCCIVSAPIAWVDASGAPVTTVGASAASSAACIDGAGDSATCVTSSLPRLGAPPERAASTCLLARL
jgi:hypothetical protein